MICPLASLGTCTDQSQLHHLGGIGYILGSVIEGNLSEASYIVVRTLLYVEPDVAEAKPHHES